MVVFFALFNLINKIEYLHVFAKYIVHRSLNFGIRDNPTPTQKYAPFLGIKKKILDCCINKYSTFLFKTSMVWDGYYF